MIKTLELNHIGPTAKMDLDFGKRLNLITGDNGLGKSFLLDIIWWALTRKWPSDLNPGLICGKMARPQEGAEAKISFSFTGKSKDEYYTSSFQRLEQSWTGRSGRPTNPGLVLYAMSDGGFALWDPARNYWRTQGEIDVQDRLPGYVFSPRQVWDGLPNPNEPSASLCNGLLEDWASWQRENGSSFAALRSILKSLTPSNDEALEPGGLTRIGIDNVKDIPTLRMPYGQDVPVVHASSGIRRMIALAYFLVWSWKEHNQAVKQLGEQPTDQVVFLIDEIESHLHPTWQRQIVPALLGVMDKLVDNAQVQMLAVTHSPLIMTSIEPVFDSGMDAWFDMDLEGSEVVLRKSEFEKQGTVSRWLVSSAFDQSTDRPLEYARLIRRASELIAQGAPNTSEVETIHRRLVQALGPQDEFLFRWRALCERKGLSPWCL